MTDDFEDESRASSNARRGGSAAADQIALDALRSDSPAAAREYLKRQSRLIDLQIENLKLENENLQKLDQYEVSHLRWRRFNDQIKGALQIMLVLVGAVVVVAIAAAMWNASQADGLVVDAFAVPPTFAQSGVGGDVIADDLTEKVGAIRDIANGNSLDVSKAVRKERDEEIKVEIPETGISLAQVWRYLRAWLGHERHVSGNLRDEGQGRIRLTVAMDGANAFVLSGARGDLDKLEQQAAEKLFASIDPVNYVLYLSGVGRNQDSLAAAARATQLVSDPVDRADAYSLWSNQTRVFGGGPQLAMARARVAIAIDPKIMAARRELMMSSELVGHEEDALAAARLLPTYRREDQPASQQGSGFDTLVSQGEAQRDVATGDFAHGLAAPFNAYTWDERTLLHAGFAARLHDVKSSRALLAQLFAAGPEANSFSGISRYYADAEAGDWQAAAADVKSYGVEMHADRGVSAGYTSWRIRATVQPLLAVALAHQGDFAAAHAALGDTPADCSRCITARGEVAALEKNYPAAAQFFAQSDREAPSIPFADSDWGAMLLRRGDNDGSIAKFESAHAKGPHFADPLEMWGEALMQKNRSDLALAKFEEAAKYAPNWGRLHLEWGEALAYSGHKDEARVQYRAAQALDLNIEDRARLAWVLSEHARS